MRTLPIRRLGAVGAVGFVVLNIVAFAVIGSMPKYSAAPTKIASFLTSNHKAILVAAVLLGVAMTLGVVAIAQLSDLLRTAGFPDAGTAVAIAGAAFLAVLGVGTGILGSMSQMAMSHTDPGTLRAFYMAGQFILGVPLAWLAIFLVLPVGRVALSGAFPRWAAPLNPLLALLLALGGISVRGKGALGVGTGVFAWLASLALLVFFLEVAFLLWRAAATGPRFAEPVTTSM